MQMVDLESAPTYGGGGIREGTLDTKELLVGREGDPNNYRVALTFAETDWAAPRHRHNFDQIRFPISGAFHYSKEEILPAGHVAYFPEGVHYGPQLRQKGLLMLTIQFGGASGAGFLSEDQLVRARNELSAKGTFEKGTYTHIDESGKRHRQDGIEACWERAMGRRLEYPAPRYEGQVRMNPANYDWIPDESLKGVAHKCLGTFTERNLRFGFVKVDKAASLPVATENVPHFLFLVEGRLSHAGKSYGRHAAFGFEANEQPINLKAEEASELLWVHLPRF